MVARDLPWRALQRSSSTADTWTRFLHFEFPSRRIDYQRLVQEISRPAELFRAYYYHCLPYQSNPPTPEEKSFYSSKQRFMKALSFLPRFEVRLGRLVKRGCEADGSPVFIQKRVDCMVGVDMASLAAKGKITNVVLVSGDSDLVPAVEAVKRESVLVTLWHGAYSRDSKPSRELARGLRRKAPVHVRIDIGDRADVRRPSCHFASQVSLCLVASPSIRDVPCNRRTEMTQTASSMESWLRSCWASPPTPRSCP